MPNNLSGMDIFSEKIFPEEVDNIKSYMTETFTTNVNGYSKNLGDLNNLNSQMDKFNPGSPYYNRKKFLNKRFMNNNFNNIGIII